jgi:predicted lipoprotein
VTHRIRAVALTVAIALASGTLSACSDDAGRADGNGSGGTATEVEVLTSIADGVVIPSYEALVANAQALASALDELCRAPSTAALGTARDRWRDTELAWQSTRASGVGPAIEMRSMQAIAFAARGEKVDDLLAGAEPVTPEALDALGADVRGIYGVEHALFAPGSDAMASPAGERRCTYARSATELASAEALAILDRWTRTDETSYRDTFLAGMDGKPISSIGAVVNEMAFRLQQADDQGLRAMAAARTAADLPSTRREGPAGYGVASIRGVLGGIVAVVQGPDGKPGLADLVRSRSADTADRLEELAAKAVEALRPLPDSSAAAIDGDHAAVEAAARALADLRVLVTTEVASQLGVTIGFSDSDGDS